MFAILLSKVSLLGSDGVTIIFSYHFIQPPGFDLMSAELCWAVFGTLNQLSYQQLANWCLLNMCLQLS